MRTLPFCPRASGYSNVTLEKLYLRGRTINTLARTNFGPSVFVQRNRHFLRGRIAVNTPPFHEKSMYIAPSADLQFFWILHYVAAMLDTTCHASLCLGSEKNLQCSLLAGAAHTAENEQQHQPNASVLRLPATLHSVC